MDFDLYMESEVERWIAEHYQNNSILTPTDIDIDVIASNFGIDIVYYNGHSFSGNESDVIFLNKNLSSPEMREIFFHELCHVLRHAGDQRRMPQLFMDLQEFQALQFQLYAAIPLYMIKDIPPQRSWITYYQLIAYKFVVPLWLAKRRIEQIITRTEQVKWDIEFQNNYNRPLTLGANF